jgi:hypothetical protein
LAADFGRDEGRLVLQQLGYFGRGGAVRLADVYRFHGDPPDGWPEFVLFGLPDLELRLPVSILRLFLEGRGIPHAAIDRAFASVFEEH